MDKLAVWEASEKQLEELGLHEKGHIICLKSYCFPSNHELKKNELAVSIRSASNERVASSKRRRNNSKTITLGWMHYIRSKHKYISVRSSNGGGSRNVIISPDTKIFEILVTLKELFFPNGKSCHGRCSIYAS